MTMGVIFLFFWSSWDGMTYMKQKKTIKKSKKLHWNYQNCQKLTSISEFSIH
jgi:hypothetical protein